MTKSIFDKSTKPVAGSQAHPDHRLKVPKRDEDTDPDSKPVAVGRPEPKAEDLVETLTLEQIKHSVPPHLLHSVTQDTVDMLNGVSADPLLGSIIRENFLSYTKVLADGRFKLEDYLSAVKYVTFKLMGYSNEEAYSRTFPNRFQSLNNRQLSKKEISSHVSAYHKNKLVNLIMENAIMPSWVLNQDMFQSALNTQYQIMNDATINARDRVAAANSIIMALQKPKQEGKFEINIGQVENSGMKEMREMMQQLANQQHEKIINGEATTLDMTKAELVPRDRTPVKTVPKL